ncbi:GNAT family N-acetyltransferase [Bacillus spongiae]|uniref:GNAT family N-acetyltransferase n=1 Tax=Bacillus spongiae TaxID=2683610 RepID=A0ABU8HI16_9BACI
MIRRLNGDDHRQVMNLLQPKSAENLFIIGDIEAYGYEQDFQMLWGDFDSEENLRGVLLKYEENYIPYASEMFDVKGFSNIINKDQYWTMLSGLKRITSMFQPFLNRKLIKKRELFYAKCYTADKLILQDMESVKKANVDHIEEIVDLYDQIPEFESTEGVERKRRNMVEGVSRTYFIERDGKMIAAASTAAENTLSAMVVGVCTLPAYQKQGYATRCISKLTADVLAEGKELCLFYDNPDAGKIYKRLGFEEIDEWVIYRY